jgi:hypothetical protein
MVTIWNKHECQTILHKEPCKKKNTNHPWIILWYAESSTIDLTARGRSKLPPYPNLGKHLGINIYTFRDDNWSTTSEETETLWHTIQGSSHSHHIGTPLTSSDVIKEEGRHRLQSSTCPTVKHQTISQQPTRVPAREYAAHPVAYTNITVCRMVRSTGYLPLNATGWSTIKMEEELSEFILTRPHLLHKSDTQGNNKPTLPTG